MGGVRSDDEFFREDLFGRIFCWWLSDVQDFFSDPWSFFKRFHGVFPIFVGMWRHTKRCSFDHWIVCSYERLEWFLFRVSLWDYRLGTFHVLNVLDTSRLDLQSTCSHNALLVKSHVTGDCYHMFNMIISIEQVFLHVFMLTTGCISFYLKNMCLGKTTATISSQLPKHSGLTFPFASRPLAELESTKYLDSTTKYKRHWISIWNYQVVVWIWNWIYSYCRC